MNIEPGTTARAEIITITPDELNAIIQLTSERTVNHAIKEFKTMLAEQKEYYERYFTVAEIAAELQCSIESVYRYWRDGKLKHGQIKPSEKGSSRAQIDDFRRNLVL